MLGQRRRSPRTILLAAGTAILMITGFTGCARAGGDQEVVSAGGEATPERVADRAQKITQYRDCLVQQGIPLLEQPTEEGLPQIDKNRAPAEKVSAGLQECRKQLPDGGELVKVSQEDIQARQRYAACIRDHGVLSYPDPDPRTGEQIPNEELARQLKNDPELPAAEQACQSVRPSTSNEKGTVGG